MEGTIKFYNSNDGYGFIFSTNTNKDYYFNITEWKNETLPNAGQKVKFCEFKNKKGLSAKDIKLLKDCENKANTKSTDDRITCPSCGKKIVPRIQYLNSTPYASHCPYCATEIKKFQDDVSGSRLPFFIFWLVFIVFIAFFIFNWPK